MAQLAESAFDALHGAMQFVESEFPLKGEVQVTQEEWHGEHVSEAEFR